MEKVKKFLCGKGIKILNKIYKMRYKESIQLWEIGLNEGLEKEFYHRGLETVDDLIKYFNL